MYLCITSYPQTRCFKTINIYLIVSVGQESIYNLAISSEEIDMHILEDDRAGLSEKLNVEEVEKEIRKNQISWLHQLPRGIIGIIML